MFRFGGFRIAIWTMSPWVPDAHQSGPAAIVETTASWPRHKLREAIAPIVRQTALRKHGLTERPN